jgi:hypothetical protein
MTLQDLSDIYNIYFSSNAMSENMAAAIAQAHL